MNLKCLKGAITDEMDNPYKGTYVIVNSNLGPLYYAGEEIPRWTDNIEKALKYSSINELPDEIDDGEACLSYYYLKDDIEIYVYLDEEYRLLEDRFGWEHGENYAETKLIYGNFI